MRNYTGPSPKFFTGKEKFSEDVIFNHDLLNSSEEFAEVSFLRNLFHTENLPAKVAYVPSTVWNLYATYTYFVAYKENPKKAQEDYSLPENNVENYFHLSCGLMQVLESSDQKKDSAYFKDLAQMYLGKLENCRDVSGQWGIALSKERNKQENSIFNRMIEEELEASRQNKILLVRSTKGIDLQSKASTDEEVKKRLLVKIMGGFSSLEKQIKQLEIRNPDELKRRLQLVEEEFAVYPGPQWYETFEQQQKILDFAEEGFSAWRAIDQLVKEVKNNRLTSSKDLSYADSFLSGFLFDSYYRGRSACSFVFYDKDPSLLVYTLHLDKKWLFTKGLSLFHFRHESLETDSIFEHGEAFHPRLRSVRKVENKVLAEDFYSRIDTALLDSPDRQDINFIQNEDNRKFVDFVLQANNVIGQAKIISLKGEIVHPDNYPSQALEILKNQKEASQILMEKLKS